MDHEGNFRNALESLDELTIDAVVEAVTKLNMSFEPNLQQRFTAMKKQRDDAKSALEQVQEKLSETPDSQAQVSKLQSEVTALKESLKNADSAVAKERTLREHTRAAFEAGVLGSGLDFLLFQIEQGTSKEEPETAEQVIERVKSSTPALFRAVKEDKAEPKKRGIPPEESSPGTPAFDPRTAKYEDWARLKASDPEAFAKLA